MHSGSVKITYAIKDKNAVHSFVVWNETEEAELGIGTRLLLRNLKKDYFKGNIQLTLDELSDIIPLEDGLNSPTDGSSPAKKQKKELYKDDLGIFPMLKAVIGKNPTAAVQHLMDVLDKIKGTKGTNMPEMWLPLAIDVITQSYNDEKNQAIILQMMKSLMKEIPSIAPCAANSVSKIFEDAMRLTNKKTRAIIQKELILFVANMNEASDEDDDDDRDNKLSGQNKSTKTAHQETESQMKETESMDAQ